MKLLMRAALASLVAILFTAQAFAAGVSSYAVLPFQVNGAAGFKYLERAIPQMFTSRLYWKDHFHPVSQDALAKVNAPATDSDAQKAQASLGADYAIWGSVTIIGDDASLDVRVRDKSGKIWPKAGKAKVAELINALQSMADSINTDVFGRASSGPAATTQSNKVVNQMHPEFVQNEVTQQTTYLNPQFRYQGSSADETRLRSQTLNFSAIGMLVDDVVGNGKNQILLLDDHVLYAYRWENGRLAPAGEYRFSMSVLPLNIRAIDLNRDGRKEIIISAYEEHSNEPYSYVLNYDGANFSEVMTRVRYFLNVEKLPPDFTPVLIGQKGDSPKLFKPGVYEMMKNGDKLMEGKRLELPEGANVFNFAYLPGGSKGEGDKIVTLSDRERLRVFSAKGARLSESDENYSGTATGIPIEPNMPGLGKDKVLLKSIFYIPMRMLAVDFERNGEYKLLVNRPISTASQFFERYRFFPQGEIHALFWDGVGMNLQWKTRRVKGSVADFAIADVNNDGVMDLVLMVNTHPGALGMESRKTALVAYPLDLSKVDPNTAADLSEMQ